MVMSKWIERWKQRIEGNFPDVEVTEMCFDEIRLWRFNIKWDIPNGFYEVGVDLPSFKAANCVANYKSSRLQFDCELKGLIGETRRKGVDYWKEVIKW